MILIKAPIIEVQNVVASGEFDQKIDLLHIAASLDRAEYNPESFPGLVLRVSEPKAVFLLFSTGKLVCTGGKSKEDVYAAIETLVKKLRSIDINVNSPP
ncbi:MAG: TATA-box-binding protein, partial [Promethearchaeota archaeon]